MRLLEFDTHHFLRYSGRKSAIEVGVLTNMKKKVITTADLATSIETVASSVKTVAASLATSTASLTSSVAAVATSLDQLAISVKEGFDVVDERFDGVDQRFERVDHRLDQLEQGQDEIKLRLGNVAYRFELNDLGQRVDRLERRVGAGSL